MLPRAFLLLTLIVLPCCRVQVSEQTTHSDRFGDIRIFNSEKPSGRMVIYFSSGALPPEGVEIDSLRALGAAGYAVAAVDSQAYARNIDATGGDCSYLGGEIERLGQSTESALKLPAPSKPILAGSDSGAALAIAIAAQDPEPFAGVLLQNISATLPQKTRICNEGSLKTVQDPTVPGNRILVTPGDLKLPIATLGMGHDDSATQKLSAEIKSNIGAAGDSLTDLAKRISTAEAKQSEERASVLGTIPVVTMPPQPGASGEAGAGYLAIFVSGDGGWAAIDKEVSAGLNDAGFAIAGIDSLKFLWRAKSAKEAAEAIEKTAGHFLKEWKLQGVVLVGFSLGADTISAALREMTAQAKQQVKSIVLLSPGTHADLQVHISGWIGFDDESAGIEIKPELEAAKALKITCIYGSDDDDTVCPALDKSAFSVVELPGDHHFDGDYETVVGKIVDSIKKK